MRGGRARWKIENETFNTLKNQGYNFEHNYGLGEKKSESYLCHAHDVGFSDRSNSTVLVQTVPGCMEKRKVQKKYLWEQMRTLFKSFVFSSMQQLYQAIIYGIKVQPPIILNNSS
jgi:hypothetical protein